MTKKSLPLDGLVVLERSLSISGGFAGRQLADAGARVLLMPTEAPEWWVENPSSHLRGYLHADKLHVSDAGDEDFEALAAAVDIVIWESALPPEPERIQRVADGRVLVMITPRGLTGPRADDPWTEFTLQAESGSLHMRGDADREPIQSGSSEALWLAGASAAAAALAGLTREQTTIIDLSILVASHAGPNNFTTVAAALAGETREPRVMRRKLMPSVEQASDGWVGFNLASAQNLEDFMVLVERPDWLGDPGLRSSAGRYARSAEWNESVREWTSARPVDEIVAQANEFRIPVAPVHDGRTIREDPQMVAREFFRPAPDGIGVHPVAPVNFDGERAGAVRTACREATLAELDLEPRQARFDAPLADVRVADFGSWWAGALASCLLSSFGADVIKIESTRRIDGARTMLGILRPSRGEQWWETGQHYLALNHNKRGVTLDMTQDLGRELVERLIMESDVLIENYAPHVLEKVGLTWDRVRVLNPRIVMVRMPAYGLTGPRRDQVGYAQTVEQFSGLCARTGYADATPLNPNGIADPFAAFNAAFATLAGLHLARREHRGVFVEAALAEGAVTIAAEQAIVHSRTGTLLGRDGNHSDRAAPQGAYPTAGEEQWVALSVTTQQHWHELVMLAADQQWAHDERFAAFAGRRAHRYELDGLIAEWTRRQSSEDLLNALKARGIPSAHMVDARFVQEDEQMQSTGYYEWVDHPAAGRIALPTMPFRVRGVSRWSRTPSPTLGQHTAEVLRTDLKLSEDEIEEVLASAISGTLPLNR